MEIMKNLCSKEANGKNLVYSPLSIYAALGLLTFGAKGETLNQLLRFLKQTNLEDLYKYCSEVTKPLNETQTCSDIQGPKLSFVNSVLVEQSCILNPKFKEVANLVFQAEAEAVDFRYKANEVRMMVNRWVESKTNGLIKDLIREGIVNEYTAVILVNALHFKGLWHPGQFDKCSTRSSEFYLLDGRSVKVPFMHSGQRNQFISCYNGFKVLKLPYKMQAHAKADISMYILLPDRRDGLVELVQTASTDSFNFLSQYLPEFPPSVPTTEFRIPKFKIEFDFNAKRVLKEMGLVLPLDDSEESQADYSGMVNAKVSVKSIIHKCFVEVDEEGTVAAASTAVILGASFGWSPPPVPPVHFVADHPFMFMIKDNSTGVILFTGYVLNPLC